MKRTYQITALLFLLFSGFVCVKSLGLKYYTALGPGPGFFPFWMSLALAVLSGVMLFQATCRQVEPKPDDFVDSRQGYFRMFAVCGTWIWAVLALESLGYRLTMIVFFPLLLISLGRVRWYVTVLVTLFGSLITFWMFNHFLKVSLPFGPIDQIFDPLDDLFGWLFLDKAR
jgi:putative tricarboxylic transport membrane protein